MTIPDYIPIEWHEGKWILSRSRGTILEKEELRINCQVYLNAHGLEWQKPIIK